MESEGARRRKVLPCQTLNRQNRGGGTRGRCLFVFDLIGDVEGKKKRENPRSCPKPSPTLASFYSVSLLFGYSPSCALFSLSPPLLSAVLGLRGHWRGQ